MNELTIRTAFERLFPGQSFPYELTLMFSRKFLPYNANVRKRGTMLIFRFSKEWDQISDEIGIGVVQELLLKILRKKRVPTTNMELYNNFIRNLHLSAAKGESDERLQQLFGKVNERYFNNALEMPNLRWGMPSRRKLATYNYHTDTITVSSLFRDAQEQLLSYLLYHEMLHKHLKYRSNGGRSLHHSKEFREQERAFTGHDALEQELQFFLRSKSARSTRKPRSWLLRFFE